MWQRLDVQDDSELKEPVVIVALSTSIPQYYALYSHARELAKYMLKKMKHEQLATLYSSALPPEVRIRKDGTLSIVSDHFYRLEGDRDIVLLAGDTSPLDNQYEFTRLVLGYAKKTGAKEIYSVGTRWTDAPLREYKSPEVLGFATDSGAAERLKSSGVTLMKDEPSPFFASMVVGLAREFGLKGYKLSVNHGEPVPHPRSVARMLEVLSALIGFRIDLSDLSGNPSDNESEVPAPSRQDAANIYQ